MASRQEQKDYENDVFYEVWRRGGNADRIDDDRVLDNFYDGREADEAAQIELNAQRAARARHSELFRW